MLRRNREWKSRAQGGQRARRKSSQASIHRRIPSDAVVHMRLSSILHPPSCTGGRKARSRLPISLWRPRATSRVSSRFRAHASAMHRSGMRYDRSTPTRVDGEHSRDYTVASRENWPRCRECGEEMRCTRKFVIEAGDKDAMNSNEVWEYARIGRSKEQFAIGGGCDLEWCDGTGIRECSNLSQRGENRSLSGISRLLINGTINITERISVHEHQLATLFIELLGVPSISVTS